MAIRAPDGANKHIFLLLNIFQYNWLPKGFHKSPSIARMVHWLSPPELPVQVPSTSFNNRKDLCFLTMSNLGKIIQSFLDFLIHQSPISTKVKDQFSYEVNITINGRISGYCLWMVGPARRIVSNPPCAIHSNLLLRELTCSNQILLLEVGLVKQFSLEVLSQQNRQVRNRWGSRLPPALAEDPVPND